MIEANKDGENSDQSRERKKVVLGEPFVAPCSAGVLEKNLSEYKSKYYLQYNKCDFEVEMINCVS